jgi:hypothetical protein
MRPEGDFQAVQRASHLQRRRVELDGGRAIVAVSHQDRPDRYDDDILAVVQADSIERGPTAREAGTV